MKKPKDGIDDEAGLLLIQTAMEAFDRMREAQKQLEDDGLTVQDRWGQKKPHPLTTVERDSRAQMVLCLKSLQLDFDIK